MFWLYNPRQKSLKFEIDEILRFYKLRYAHMCSYRV